MVIKTTITTITKKSTGCLIHPRKSKNFKLFFSIFHKNITDFERKQILTEVLRLEDILSICKILRYFCESKRLAISSYNTSAFNDFAVDIFALETRVLNLKRNSWSRIAVLELADYISKSKFLKRCLPFWKKTFPYKEYLRVIPGLKINSMSHIWKDIN